MSAYVKPAAVKRRAIEECAATLGAGRVTRVSSALVTACDLAVEEVIRRAIAQHKRTSKTLEGPVAGLPARGRR